MSVTHTLKRSGNTPIQFNGELIFERNNYSRSVPVWHEINVFSNEEGGYVLLIKSLKKRDGDPDIINVYKVGGAKELIHQIIRHDPKADLASQIDLTDASLSEYELTLQATQLVQMGATVSKNWSAMVGELLHDFYKMSSAQTTAEAA